MKKISRFIGGTILGTAIASALVLLLTPKSGPELRNQFKQRLIDISDEIKFASEEKRRELEDELHRLKTE